MKITITRLVCLSGLLAVMLMTGCYSIHTMTYAGQQQDWPTATGSFVDTHQPVPVYYGFPPKPYIYLEQIQVTAKDVLADILNVAAAEAKAKHADALLVLNVGDRPIGVSSFGSSFSSANVTAQGSAQNWGNGYTTAQGTAQGYGSSFGSSVSRVNYGGLITAIAIQWKTNSP